LADICVINEVVEKSAINPDVIIALKVLQHVEKPANAISACHKALSDGGGTVIFYTLDNPNT
jgi:2-polyprenyl-3-methyl-5-hydroxy-6-metoxy-1,4-benzoquinol methylase